MRAVQTSPCQSCVPSSAVSMMPGVSGKKSIGLPRTASGRPATVSTSMPRSTRAWLRVPPAAAAAGRDSGCGWAWRAASKSCACMAVVLAMGTCRVKVPSSGMHSLRQTSQEAWRVKVALRASGPGENAPETVMGTGSSTVPS